MVSDSAVYFCDETTTQKAGHVARPSEVLEFGTATGFSVTCARSLAIASGENSALTPDSDPKLHLAPRFWPKIATRNLGGRPQILYRTNFHKCRCSHILKRSRVIFKPHKWTNCAKSEPQSLKARVQPTSSQNIQIQSWRYKKRKTFEECKTTLISKSKTHGYGKSLSSALKCMLSLN